MSFTCEKCNKTFNNTYNHTRHVNRKISCIIKNDKNQQQEKDKLCFDENKYDSKTENRFDFIDLFAGTGAFSYALEETQKFKCVFANDMIDSCKQIYDLNHTNCELTLKDLNDIECKDIPKHSLLCAGFPCQPFSIAGQQKGFDDSRSNVFWKILEILKIHNPRFVILENVKNLKSHDKGNTYKTIISNLEKLGYFMRDNILNTSKITTIPHHRERIYIVGFKNKDDYDNFDFNFSKKQKNKIKNYLEDNVDNKYYYDSRFKVYDLIEKTIDKDIDNDIIYQYRRYYVRENKNNCCPTLTANMGGGGHNVPLLKDKKGIRKLTPRECFNLQGFPQEYKLPNISDSHLYKLAGNAVSIPVVSLIAKKLVDIIENDKNE
jgi:DNA (cytosine-5)-methyltransferase 1